MTEDDASRLAAEARARVLIDRQLEAAGWSVQNKKAMNLFAARGVAVREITLKPGHGRVDYLLYVDQSVVGVIEAKPEGTPLSGVEWQSSKYAEGLPADVRLASLTKDGPPRRKALASSALSEMSPGTPDASAAHPFVPANAPAPAVTFRCAEKAGRGAPERSGVTEGNSSAFSPWHSGRAITGHSGRAAGPADSRGRKAAGPEQASDAGIAFRAGSE